jgi:sugar/nucleoside kinase (ribokinase family)
MVQHNNNGFAILIKNRQYLFVIQHFYLLLRPKIRCMKYDVYGIGNAIVDIITEVDHDFFTKNEVEKGVMTLVDEKRQLHLMKAIDMKKSKMSGGGSAGNTVVALNQFGGKSFYSLPGGKGRIGRILFEGLKEKRSGYKSYARAVPRRT